MDLKPGILILEDNYLTADALSDLVRSCGYDVVATVGYVDSAFQFLADHDVDGAIVDINLHGDASFPVCHELKRRSVPFFFLSGYERSVVPALFSEHRLLSKPVDLARFRTALAEFGKAQRQPRAELGNALLDALPRAAFAALEPRLERVDLMAGKVLQYAHQPTPYVHFPTGSLVSLVARDRRGRRLEVGQVGHEGVIGAAEALTSGAPALTEAVVELPGGAWRLATAELTALMRLHRNLQADLLRYALRRGIIPSWAKPTLVVRESIAVSLRDPHARRRAAVRCGRILDAMADDLRGAPWYSDGWLESVVNGAHQQLDHGPTQAGRGPIAAPLAAASGASRASR